MKRKLTISLVYILTIVVVNLGFAKLPFIQTPFGILPVMAFVVGVIFILRDFAQRAMGHYKVIPLMLVGAIITWFTVSKEIAIASVLAFLISEFVDWLVYTYTNRSFEDRVLLSSSMATPLDSFVFLYMIGAATVGSVFIMTLSKMVAAVAIWYTWRKLNVEARVGSTLG